MVAGTGPEGSSDRSRESGGKGPEKTNPYSAQKAQGIQNMRNGPGQGIRKQGNGFYRFKQGNGFYRFSVTGTSQ